MNKRDAVAALVALGTVAVSCRTSAQPGGRVWRVGFLSLSSPSVGSRNAEAFRRGMRVLGYDEGRNLAIEWRYADGKFERLPDLAAELVQAKVDVIVAEASAAIGAAQKATASIPIVMATTGDPVGSGFVNSLARPGGNITGLSNMGGDTGAKLLELLLSVLPKPPRVAVLVTPTSTTYRVIVEGVQGAAQRVGVKTLVAEATTPREIEAAFATMARDNANGVIVGSAPFFAQHRKLIIDQALKYRLPSMFGNPAYVEDGGLMGYGASITENFVRAATYVDKILKGSKPADLPVEQPAKFELVVNLKTARSLGLTIPQTILLRADELIQ